MEHSIEICVAAVGLLIDADTTRALEKLLGMLGEGLVWGAVAGVICLPVVLIMRNKKKGQIGTIRCKRCNYVGTVKVMRSWPGFKSVCHKCQSEDWVTIDSGKV